MPDIPPCGSASALPPPSLGVSSLDLGRWRASGLFFDSTCFSIPRAAPRYLPDVPGREPCGPRMAAAVILAIEICATRWHLLRRGNAFVAAARCGRFLPRLGSLATLVTLFLSEKAGYPALPLPHAGRQGDGNRDESNRAYSAADL